MSVSSDYALYGKFTTPEMYEDYITNGISDTLIGTVLDNVLSAEDFAYYRETFHSHAYIAYHWGRFFEVVAIEGGAHNGFQDVVVLRKK